MKILALSDSHGYTKLMYEVIEILLNKIDMVVFLGDCIDDIIDYTYIYEDKAVHYVAGNCDTHYFEPGDLEFIAGGKKFFLTHGHKYSVKGGHDDIYAEAKKREAQICLYGHSHSPEIFTQNGIYFMNPGSISLPRGISRYPTYGLIDVDGAGVSGKIMSVRDGKFTELKL